MVEVGATIPTAEKEKRKEEKRMKRKERREKRGLSFRRLFDPRASELAVVPSADLASEPDARTVEVYALDVCCLFLTSGCHCPAGGLPHGAHNGKAEA